MILFALYRAQETAKAHKTRALIAKLDAVIKDKWQTYQYRRVPLYLGPDQYDDSTGNVAGQYDSADNLLTDWYGDGTYRSTSADPRSAAKIRLEAIHELMRWELPDRYSDVVQVQADGTVGGGPTGPSAFLTPTPIPTMVEPSLAATYRKRINSAPNRDIINQGAEMLYLIVMQSLAGDEDSRDVFKPDNIGDVDNDGMPEFIDGWGRPIKFLRWAPGLISDLQILARAVVSNATPNSGTTTVTASGLGLSATNGAYVGGAMGIIDANPPAPNTNLSPKPIFGTRMARITGYTYSGGTGTFTCAGSPAGQAFNGQPPSSGNTIVIMAPDPFDPTDIQRISEPRYYAPDKYVPSFAIYPFIYSAGPDGKYGILADAEASSAKAYSYTANAVRPFVEFSATLVDPPYLLFGASAEIEAGYPNASLDNIHNHLQGLR